MSDLLGLSEGAKGLSSGLDSAREAGKSVSKQIENIQKDAVDVAQQKAQERLRSKREAEVKKQYNGQVTIVPEPRQITVGVSLYRILSGKESLAEFTQKAIRSIETQMTIDVYTTMAATMAALPSTATTGLQIAG